MAAKIINHSVFLVLTVLLLSISHSEQLQSSNIQTLLRIQQLLNFPSVLSTWNNNTDFCNMEPNSSATILCYEETITQLHIIGEKRNTLLLPRNFSMDSFVTTLVKLPNLKVLTLVSLGLWGRLPGKISRLSSLEILNMSSNFLYGSIPQEISSLTSLHTFILDDNMLSGRVPDWLNLLPDLTVLSLNKNFFNGSLPNSLSELGNLRVLALSNNHLYGNVPDLRQLKNLQVLELEDNAFGPEFPRLGNKLVRLVLSKNRFRSGIPSEVSSCYQLQRLDISLNTFVGPFPTDLLSLPSLAYLNISGNKLTGVLFKKISCNGELSVVDLSSNLLSGILPECLVSDSRDKVVLYSRNCLATSDQSQHPLSFCRNEALAVGILPQRKKRRQASNVVLILGIIGGCVTGIILIGLIVLFVRRASSKKLVKNRPTKLISEHASRGGYTSKLLTDARYITQTMKLGAVGLSAYRTFSLEEIEEATNNFDSSAFIGEGSHGQMYRGRLTDGSWVAIRCLKMKRRYSTQNFMHHIELISKLRHRHLVCTLGHCFECYLDDSSVRRIFLIFEYVPNGTLRSWISEERLRQSLTWTQRISAAIGIAKGIQFLHTGIVPGIYPNNPKITDILLDQNLVAKISCYNLPLLAESMGKVGHGIYSGGSRDPCVSARASQEAQLDVFDFGVILLEIILGKQVKCRNEVDVLKDNLQAGVSSDDRSRRSIVDPAVHNECSDQSWKTMMEVCVRCLMKDPADRPSIEDVLWNLQFAAQVQDAWGRESTSNEGSPDSAVQPPHVTRH